MDVKIASYIFSNIDFTPMLQRSRMVRLYPAWGKALSVKLQRGGQRTDHDPCDLGRGAREINSLLVDLSQHGKDSGRR